MLHGQASILVDTWSWGALGIQKTCLQVSLSDEGAGVLSLLLHESLVKGVPRGLVNSLEL